MARSNNINEAWLNAKADFLQYSRGVSDGKNGRAPSEASPKYLSGYLEGRGRRNERHIAVYVPSENIFHPNQYRNIKEK